MANLSNINNKFLVTTGGDVGINTTSPTQKLSVNGNVHIMGNGTDNDSYVLMFNNGAAAIARDNNDLELHAYNAMVFGVSNTSYPSSTERMRIDSSGNVGIGTNTPSYTLDVYHATTNVVSRFESGDNQVWIELHDDGSGSYGALLGHDSDAGHLFAVADANVTKQFVIEDSADVGIGTDSPNFRLDIVNAAASTATYQQFRNGTTGTGSGDGTVMGIDSDGDFLINNQEAKEIKLYTSDSQRLTIQSGGNVGIGTTSPNEKFVVGTTSGTQNIEISNSYIQSFNRSGSPGYAALGFYGSSYTFNVGNVEVLSSGAELIVNDTSNVPKVRFKQNGSTKAIIQTTSDDLLFQVPSERMRITSAGNVGIGTTSPYAFDTTATKLHVKNASAGSGNVG